MARSKDDLQTKEDQFIDSVKESLDDAEKLLREAADATGDKATELREKAMESLRRSRVALYDAQDAVLAKGRQAARATDDYVHDNPWQAAGLAGLAGLLVGMLISRN
ncbi:YqjD family protein [Pusillimonas sp.]|uniref:YqjD family protein n=1 Tax=Pusillimonas sp. TaxID=3040095 RepID=UPI0037C9771D